MPNVTINGKVIDVDIRYELEQFEWTRPQWLHDKLLAASPFRYDNHPSFYVYTDDTPSAPAGSWGDSGAYDAEWAKGGIVKLLSFLRNETEEETADYLLSAYDLTGHDGEITLKPLHLAEKRFRSALDASILENYRYRHPYLAKRGIPERIQRLMTIGYSQEKDAITIPWFFPDGRLANVKYRKTRGKTFWYAKGATPIRELVYGLDVVYDRDITEAVICEAEIDAMSWMAVGIPAIAVGGVAFTREKADAVKRSPIERLIINADNDRAGEKLKRMIIDRLTGYVSLGVAELPGVKDANEALVAGVDLRNTFECAENVKGLRSMLRFVEN